MKIYNHIDEFKKVKNSVVTTGTFDGVHLGHRKIISRITEIAKKENGETVILTFHPHPRMVLFDDDHELQLLSSPKEKAEMLASLGIDHLIVHPFTKKFSRTTSMEFVRNILVNKIGTKKLVIGYNHHFGRNREGSFEHLKEFGPMYGFSVEEIPQKDVDHIEVSSTKIRDALIKGDIPTANKFLGYEYSITGKVVKGKQLGKELGYPTANIDVEDKHKQIPADGVYAVTVDFQYGIYKGMMNIGNNPTVNGTKKTIEVNIFNFDNDIYGQPLHINFVCKIRDEVKFDSIEGLRKQLGLDKKKTLSILK